MQREITTLEHCIIMGIKKQLLVLCHVSQRYDQEKLIEVYDLLEEIIVKPLEHNIEDFK